MRLLFPLPGHSPFVQSDALKADSRLKDRIDAEVHRLASRTLRCGGWSLILILSIVLIPVSLILAMVTAESWSNARMLVNVTGVGRQHLSMARKGMWLAVLPSLIGLAMIGVGILRLQ